MIVTSLLGGGTTGQTGSPLSLEIDATDGQERRDVLGFYGFKLAKGHAAEAADCCCRRRRRFCCVPNWRARARENHRLVDFSNETNCFCGTDTTTCHLPAIRYRTSAAVESVESEARGVSTSAKFVCRERRVETLRESIPRLKLVARGFAETRHQ